ncbi:MAG TPA: hypothetical protein GX707_07960 [Epulopiscium sp.]|nr:hypothetical protein [Candidatus Epulonipiscium sp.]
MLIKEQMKKILKKKTTILCISIVLILIYTIKQGEIVYYYDSESYWQLGRIFNEGGKFKFSNYNSSLRGYILPLIYGIIQMIAEMVRIKATLLFNIVHAVFMGIMISTIIPELFEKLLSIRINNKRRFLFFMMVSFFWRGYYLYPLSDFPSLGAILLASNILMKKEKSFLDYVLAGMAIATSILIRPSYQVVLPVFIVVIIYTLVKQHKKNMFLYLIPILLGFAIISAPQSYINYNHFNTLSPLIQTKNSFGDRSLYLQQLSWGLSVQKYETNIGEDYPDAGVKFLDPQGEKMLINENITNLESYAQYFRLLIKYPVDAISVYSRHLFNGLDVTYSTPYIMEFFGDRVLFSLLNYTLWFLLIALIIRSDIKKKIWDTVLYNPERLYAVSILLTCVISIPGAVEVRFFLPMYIACYGVICYCSSFKQSVKDIKENWVLYTSFILICFILTGSAFANLQHGAVLIMDRILN